MGNKVECRLPSLNSLALDFALPQQNVAHNASYPIHHPPKFQPHPHEPKELYAVKHEYTRDPYTRDAYARDQYPRDPYPRDPYPREAYPQYSQYDQYGKDPRDPSRTPPNLESARTLPSVVPNAAQLKPDIFTPKTFGYGSNPQNPQNPQNTQNNQNNEQMKMGPVVAAPTAYITNTYPASYSSKSSLSEAASEEPALVAACLPSVAKIAVSSLSAGPVPSVSAVPSVHPTSVPVPSISGPSIPSVPVPGTGPVSGPATSVSGATYEPKAINHLTPERTPSEEPFSDQENGLSPKSSDSPHSESPEPQKKRKKRQCPQCLQHFSNLATHRSTHLNPTARPHVCKVCQRGFARPNDLFRHFKCHWKEMGADQGQFKCPFKNGESGNKCSHTSGIFSRCDTYKNHLKAIHFQYPEGTKKSNRSKIPGTCKLCFKEFKSVDDWITSHIETNECQAIE